MESRTRSREAPRAATTKTLQRPGTPPSVTSTEDAAACPSRPSQPWPSPPASSTADVDDNDAGQRPAGALPTPATCRSRRIPPQSGEHLCCPATTCRCVQRRPAMTSSRWNAHSGAASERRARSWRCPCHSLVSPGLPNTLPVSIAEVSMTRKPRIHMNTSPEGPS